MWCIENYIPLRELNKEDVLKTQIEKFSCLIFTGTCLAAEPSRSATFLALDIAKKNNITIIHKRQYYNWCFCKPRAKFNFTNYRNI